MGLGTKIKLEQFLNQNIKMACYVRNAQSPQQTLAIGVNLAPTLIQFGVNVATP